VTPDDSLFPINQTWRPIAIVEDTAGFLFVNGNVALLERYWLRRNCSFSLRAGKLGDVPIRSLVEFGRAHVATAGDALVVPARGAPVGM